MVLHRAPPANSSPRGLPTLGPFRWNLHELHEWRKWFKQSGVLFIPVMSSLMATIRKEILQA